MNFAVYESFLGKIMIKYDGDSVTYLKKLNEEPEALGEKTQFTDEVFGQVMEYFTGKRKVFTFKYTLHGTDFQKKVWNELLNIPYGETRSYKEIATAVGNEKASRAIGMANNKNPITIALPCHRVIGASGDLVGYAGGLEMKKYLLKMERENK